MYIKILINALQRFYSIDAKHFFVEEKTIDERTMVGCVYRYMWCQLEQIADSIADIDIEYNRKPSDYEGKDREKGIVLCEAAQQSNRCPHSKSCREILRKEMLAKKKETDKLSFRPDIIIHVRNHMQNFMHIELKKCSRDGTRLNKSAVVFDMAKVRYSTCQKVGYKYDEGVVVLLGENGFSAVQFREGRLVGRLTGNSDSEKFEHCDDIKRGKGTIEVAYKYLLEGIN